MHLCDTCNSKLVKDNYRNCFDCNKRNTKYSEKYVKPTYIKEKIDILKDNIAKSKQNEKESIEYKQQLKLRSIILRKYFID
jgi:DNA-directed RNA polymerase subunit M/transcription elongation factor TFIIS